MGSPSSVSEDSRNPSWVAGVMQTTRWPDNTNIALLTGSAYEPFSSIGGLVNKPNIYHCPADKSLNPGSVNSRVRSMSMNGWINPGKVNTAETYWGMHFQRFVQPTDFHGVSPASVFAFLDENAATINDGWFYVDMDCYNGDGSINEDLINIFDIPASYHFNACNFSYAGGHCETRRWDGGGILDDGDISWLLIHATQPIQ